ncbi:hypothetical protein FPV67DRAFT_1454470 [Lyophyllum atratum]|nr:hypothetical protein FPV67DRAFT_1454470 [Lyophyllum atratum]
MSRPSMKCSRLVLEMQEVSIHDQTAALNTISLVSFLVQLSLNVMGSYFRALDVFKKGDPQRFGWDMDICRPGCSLGTMPKHALRISFDSGMCLWVFTGRLPGLALPQLDNPDTNNSCWFSLHTGWNKEIGRVEWSWDGGDWGSMGLGHLRRGQQARPRWPSSGESRSPGAMSGVRFKYIL